MYLFSTVCLRGTESIGRIGSRHISGEVLRNQTLHQVLPYGLLISQILVDRLSDFFKYRPTVINSTYESRTYSSMGYL